MIPLVLVGLVFYVALPLWGAWRVRRTWDKFREAATEALASPEIDFSLVQAGEALPEGSFRLSGTLEAFEGPGRLWIGNDRVSVAVSLRGAPVYFLDEQPDPLGPGVEPPRRAEAASLGALPEGTQFLVWGSLTRDDRGQVVFASQPDRRLLVLAFEGNPGTVLTRAVFAGRASLDHWNSWTPISVGLGVLLAFLLAWRGLRPAGDPVTGLWSLAVALLPSTFFLPPGILLFYAFARLWTRARNLRAQLALVRLHGPRGGPGALELRRRARQLEVVAHLSLTAAMVLNVVLLAAILRFWIP